VRLASVLEWLKGIGGAVCRGRNGMRLLFSPLSICPSQVHNVPTCCGLERVRSYFAQLVMFFFGFLLPPGIAHVVMFD